MQVYAAWAARSPTGTSAGRLTASPPQAVFEAEDAATPLLPRAPFELASSRRALVRPITPIKSEIVRLKELSRTGGATLADQKGGCARAPIWRDAPCSWRTPDTYQKTGPERGTATSKSTITGTVSDWIGRQFGDQRLVSVVSHAHRPQEAVVLKLGDARKVEVTRNRIGRDGDGWRKSERRRVSIDERPER
jgi:hypothetical protein